ncbi:dihydrofolate reductase family protein [Cryptosporangium aurantiacum]|uniref:Dihydrofolate reductase n=1 Tax=Cryptosporangium aurantiacum TaxID=134849 RepID=A0A1M7HG80_9ACTN|nr:dihydrofolate reductase family protein [Cryptosporangium aurantiacum]SHM27448.1 Dihydrofolate reductase [Cryptosporangium aurantiacum]
MKLSVNIFLTLDGVMQGPGGREEDTSGGFDHGGWVVPHFDERLGQIVDEYFQQADAFLYGRGTYQIMAAHWPTVTDTDDPVATKFNAYPKYVVSNSLTDAEASWEHSTVLRGDALAAIRDLKKQPGNELQVHGCWQLARSLHAAGLIDVYRLLVFPVVVGSGKRLFDADGPASGYRTVSAETTPAGVTSLVLEPVPFSAGDFN